MEALLMWKVSVMYKWWHLKITSLSQMFYVSILKHKFVKCVSNDGEELLLNFLKQDLHNILSEMMLGIEGTNEKQKKCF